MSIDPASLAITAALTAASMALQMTKKIEGPRLTDLSVTVADYGTPYNYFYGIRRLELACIYAEPIKERKKKRKTKGGKYKEYTYFGTWACVISDHEIADVTRVWFDRHLVLDRTGAGADSVLSLADGYELEASMRVYLGTEDQLPDPRMQATIEAAEGAGTCPALRGRAYIMFEDVPLEKNGNRMPQVSCEAIRGSATRDFNLESVAIPVTTETGRFYLNPYNRQLAQVAQSTGPMVIFGANALEYRRNAGSSAFAGGTADYQGRTYAQAGSQNRAPLRCYSADTGLQKWQIGAGDVLPITDAKGSNSIYFVNGGNWSALTDISGTRQTQSYLMHWGGGDHPVFSLIAVDAIPDGTHSNGSLSSVVLDAVLIATSSASNMPGGLSVWRAVIPDHDRGVFYAIMSDATDFLIYRISCTGAPFSGYSIEEVGSISRNSGGAVFPGSGGISGWALDRATGRIILSSGSVTALYDPATDSVLTTTSDIDALQTTQNYYTGEQFGYLNRSGSNKAWLINTEDLSEIVSLTEGALPTLSAATDGAIWDQERRGIIFKGSSTLYRLTLNLIGTDGYPLADIIADVSEKVALAPADYDVTQISDVVLGYSWTQGVARDILEPLLELYDIDARPHDFLQEFIPRGSSTGGSISSDWFVREGESADRYSIAIANDTDIPHRIFLNFADVEHEQQVNTAVARRDPDAVDSQRELSIDLSTWVANVSTARRLVERLLRRRWFAREAIDCSLTAKELALEPADVRTLDLDDVPIVARLIRNNLGAGGVLVQTWERDDSAIAIQSTSEGAEMLGRPPAEILLPGLTQGFVLDVPLLRDADDQSVPFIYFAAAPQDSSDFWPGADFLFSDTGALDDFDPGWDAVASSQDVSWALCLDTLGDAVPFVLDEGNSLSVSLYNGTLVSVTEEELLADRTLNLAIIGSPANGWEIIQYQYALLESDGTYTLSRFIRGVQGTEDQIPLHGAGERIVFVSSATVLKHPQGAGRIGSTEYYRAVSQGRDLLTAETITVEYGAAANKPLSPVHVELDRDSGSGDWSITWIRRTRLGGSVVDGQDVPLGETSESYKVQIMDGDDIVRTITSTSESATYTAAQQTEDWGSTQGNLSVRVLQVSPALSLDGFYEAAAA